MKTKILCVIPVYNEELRLSNLISKVKKSQKKIRNINFLFVNNGSSDKSLPILKKNKLHFINLKKNMGVGYALILGLKFALKKKLFNNSSFSRKWKNASISNTNFFEVY